MSPRRFFTSDHHFSHDNIRVFCERPFQSVDAMDLYMINAWNVKVQPEDIVFHCGDFAWANGWKLIRALNGHIILIKGNHDQPKRGASRNLPCTQQMSMKIGPFWCLLNHRPILPRKLQNEKHDPFGDHDSAIDINYRFDFYLTGHIHNNYERQLGGRLWQGKSLNLSVELHDYAPLSEEQVLKFLEDRQAQLESKEPQLIVHRMEIE